MDNFTGYELGKTVVEGRKFIIRNTSLSQYIHIGDPFTPADVANPSLPLLPIQKGTKTFYIKKGLVSYCGDPICMTTIGIKKCNACDEKEKDYETNMQWNARIIKEKIMKLF